MYCQTWKYGLFSATLFVACLAVTVAECFARPNAVDVIRDRKQYVGSAKAPGVSRNLVSSKIRDWTGPGQGGTWIDGNKWRDALLMLHFCHFSEKEKSPGPGGSNSPTGMEQTDRCNESDTLINLTTHFHSWDNLRDAAPLVYREPCILHYQYIPPSSPEKLLLFQGCKPPEKKKPHPPETPDPSIPGIDAGLCERGFFGPYCYCQGEKVWYRADLVEYLLPLHEVNVSNHPFYSRYLLPEEILDPELPVPRPTDTPDHPPFIDIKWLQHHVKRRQERPDKYDPQPSLHTIEDDLAAMTLKITAGDTVEDNRFWTKETPIPSPIMDQMDDIPLNRERLMQTTISYLGLRGRSWTKDWRGFARHMGTQGTVLTFDPIWYVANFFVRYPPGNNSEPWFSTEIDSYLVAYWLQYSSGLRAGKYGKHLIEPEACVRYNIGTGSNPKTPGDFQPQTFTRKLVAGEVAGMDKNPEIDLSPAPGPEFPQLVPAYGADNTWVTNDLGCLARVGEIFPHYAWRRPHQSDHIWQTGFKTLTEYHLKLLPRSQRHTYRLDLDRVHFLPTKGYPDAGTIANGDDPGLDPPEINRRIIDDMARFHYYGAPYQCRLNTEAIQENWNYTEANMQYDLQYNFQDPETAQGEATFEIYTHFATCTGHRGWDHIAGRSGGWPYFDTIWRERPQDPPSAFCCDELRFW